MIVGKTEKSKCELQIEKTQINQVQKLEYLRNILLKDGTCDTEIRK